MLIAAVSRVDPAPAVQAEPVSSVRSGVAPSAGLAFVAATRVSERVNEFIAAKQKQFVLAVAYWAAVYEQNERQAEAERAQAAARAHTYTQTYTYRPPVRTAPAGLIPAQTPCAIPAYICQRESGMTVNAENPISSASGKYQFLDSTWNGYGGYSHAADAPEAVQDAKARETYAGGAGAGHWACC